jgi:DNA-binding NarL/FixJ family response regulator
MPAQPGPGTRVHLVWQVLIVEDDAQMREFFAGSVARCDQLSLVASVGTVAEARACLTDPQQTVHVLLTDLGLPDGTGLDLIRLARQHRPACECLVISMFGDEENVLASIEAGALGYIHKDAAPEDIAQTVLEMKAGASPISPMIARRVLAKYRLMQGETVDTEPVNVPAPETHRPALSNRELEVLELIARGFSYAEISRLKQISVHTVQSHIKGLYGKLEVHSKNEAVFEATRLGLLQRS